MVGMMVYCSYVRTKRQFCPDFFPVTSCYCEHSNTVSALSNKQCTLPKLCKLVDASQNILLFNAHSTVPVQSKEMLSA